MVNPPLPNFIHTKLDLAHFTSPSHLRPQASTILRTTKSHIFSKDSGQHRLSNRYGNYTAESLIFCYSNYLTYFHQYDRHQADLRSSERDLFICLSVPGYWSGQWVGRNPPRTVVAHEVMGRSHYERPYTFKILGTLLKPSILMHNNFR